MIDELEIIPELVLDWNPMWKQLRIVSALPVKICPEFWSELSTPRKTYQARMKLFLRLILLETY